MDSTLPVAVPPAYPSRRGWLIAFGIIEILFGCSFLLMIVFSAFIFLGPVGAKMPPSPMGPSPMSPLVLMVFAAFQYGLLAAVFITAGIGSIRCKNWARILMLVVSGLWLACGLLGTLMMVFILPAVMRQQPVHVAPGIQDAIVVGMITFMAVLMVLLPAIFLFFYTRKSVRATCLAQKMAQAATLVGGETPAPGLPVPLIILGVWQGLGVLSVFAIMFFRVTFVFGVILHGAAAILVLLTYTVLSGYAAWSIFRQKLIGWKIALFFAGFGAINMLVTFVRQPDMLQLYREMGFNDQALRIYEQFPQFLPVVWVGTIVGITAFLVFLLYTRKFFPTDKPA
jgi:hypothetical protein